MFLSQQRYENYDFQKTDVNYVAGTCIPNAGTSDNIENRDNKDSYDYYYDYYCCQLDSQVDLQDIILTEKDNSEHSDNVHSINIHNGNYHG